MSDQRHPYADHPAASVLADHIAAIGVRAATSRAACECGWRGAVCDYPAHLTEMLDQAGLLKPADPPPTLATCRHCHAAIRESPGAFGATWWRTDDGGLICGGESGDAHEPAGLPADAASPETPTQRVLAERTPTQVFADHVRRSTDDPVLLARVDELDHTAARADRRTT